MILVFCCAMDSRALEVGKGIRIQSESMRVMDQSGEIRFQGKVRVDLEGTRMECDRLDLQASEGDPPEVYRGTATGNVLIVRGQDRVIADEARFDLREGTVELRGSPRLERGDATITARTILYRLQEGTADFQGQVEAEFEIPGD